MRAIEEFHGLRHGYCRRCGQPARCEKAHVVERALGGTDDVSNLIPLCYPCHGQMPIFSPEEETYAWAWVKCDSKTYFSWRWQQVKAMGKASEYPDELPDEMFEILLHIWPNARGDDYTDLTQWRFESD